MQPAPRAPHPARAARSCGRNLLNRLLPRAPATAGSPIPRRRGRTGPDASFPAARVAAVPQPDSRSPVPAAGPLTCTCLRKWRGPGTASGQKQQQQQQRGWPRHLAHGTTREPALGAPSVRPSVSRCRLPTLLQRHSRRLLLVTRRFGQTSARLLVRTRRSGHRSTILPSLPPACAAAAAASQQQQRQQPCGTAGPGSRAPAAMMGCVM